MNAILIGSVSSVVSVLDFKTASTVAGYCLYSGTPNVQT